MRTSILAIWLFAVIVLCSILGSVCFVLGGVVAEQQCYQQYFSEREQGVLGVIRQEQWSKSIQIGRDSKGRVVLLGSVDSKTLQENLAIELMTVIGKRDAYHAVVSLEVKGE